MLKPSISDGTRPEGDERLTRPTHRGHPRLGQQGTGGTGGTGGMPRCTTGGLHAALGDSDACAGSVWRSALRIAKYNLSGWIGIRDSPEDVRRWRTGIQQELDQLDTPHTMDDVEMCSMIWSVITDEQTDQTPNGAASGVSRYEVVGRPTPVRRRTDSL